MWAQYYGYTQLVILKQKQLHLQKQKQNNSVSCASK